MIPKMQINAAELERLRQKGVKISYPTLSPKAAQVAEGIAAADPLRRAAPWMQRHKFNAQRLELDGRKFSSKAEAQYYAYLQLKQQAGDLLFCLWQVPFHIPGKPNTIRLVIDFVEFWADGRIEFVDVKGMQTEAFKIKRRAVQAVYPVKIKTVKMLKAGPRYEDEA